jgi:haloalkane dehalogenase
LRLVAETPDRFDRVVASNTFLPTGERDLGDAFHAWKRFSQESPKFPIGFIVRGGCATKDEIPDEVVAAYDAPFPDDSYKAGARQFPTLVPASPDDPAAPANRKAWEVLRAWDKPFLTAFGDSDPITRGADRVLQKEIPGSEGQPHVTIEGGGHFIQEDKGEELARIVVAFMSSTGARAG